MITIGVVGGVASGKSLAAQLLAEHGAGLLDADRAGHEVLASDPAVHAEIRRRWGDSVFSADGGVDRREVGRRVFGSDAQSAADRRFLEKLLHPRIRTRLEGERSQFALEGRFAVVLDAPLLLEVGWDAICDIVLMVDASREIRLARAQRRGWTEAEFDRREAAQWSVDRKRRHSDFVINNDGSETALGDAVATFWAECQQ